MEVSFSIATLLTPPNTEITTYMWPGFLGEFDHTTLEFHVWELISPTRWIPRPDIVAPPIDCIGVETTRCFRDYPSESRQEGFCLRRMEPALLTPSDRKTGVQLPVPSQNTSVRGAALPSLPALRSPVPKPQPQKPTYQQPHKPTRQRN